MVAELGVIEGYFGMPWSHGDRKHVMTRLRDIGYSWFHYAPKADAFLRRRWREPHPSDASAELAELSGHCRGLGMRFGAGLSPCELYRDFSGPGRSDFIAKVRALDDLGIDDLAILFDDTRGDMPDLAAREAEIVHAALARTCASRVLPSYPEGTAYRYMHAFRTAARDLAGGELADMLEHDLLALQDRGLDQLGDDRGRLRRRYADVDHPMAAEVVRWLDGTYTVDRWVEDA